MARIAGVDIPREKRVEIALTYIFGVGPHTARRVLTIANVDPNLRVKNLNDEQVGRLRDVLDKEAKVEGELRREIALNIKRLMEIGTYRGLRHRRGLPVRGQRTRTNARTRRGPRKTVGVPRHGAWPQADRDLRQGSGSRPRGRHPFPAGGGSRGHRDHGRDAHPPQRLPATEAEARLDGPLRRSRLPALPSRGRQALPQ